VTPDEQTDRGDDRRGDEVVQPLSDCLMSTQRSPRTTPPQTSSITHGIAPRTENVTKRHSGMRAMPAGIEMNVRTTGIIRDTKTVTSPQRLKWRSARSRSCIEMRTYFP